MIIQHPSYPNMQVSISNPKYPEFDGTQNCNGLPSDAFFYTGQGAHPEDYEEPWIEPPTEQHPSMRQRRVPYPTYSRHDAVLLGVCESCPFLKDCFVHALHNEEFGFWGGTNAGQRGALRRKLKLRLGSSGSFSIFGDKDVVRIRELLQAAKEVRDGD